MADLNNFVSLNPALFEQHDRLVKLTTPLGDDILLPQRVLAHERLSRGYEYTIDCLSANHDIELKRLIAQPVTLWVRQTDRAYLPVHGYVHRRNAWAVTARSRSTRCLLRRGCTS